jgi:hypothetical protein
MLPNRRMNPEQSPPVRGGGAGAISGGSATRESIYAQQMVNKQLAGADEVDAKSPAFAAATKAFASNSFPLNPPPGRFDLLTSGGFIYVRSKIGDADATYTRLFPPTFDSTDKRDPQTRVTDFVRSAVATGTLNGETVTGAELANIKPAFDKSGTKVAPVDFAGTTSGGFIYVRAKVGDDAHIYRLPPPVVDEGR